jgi:hypothetical protein
MHAQFVSYTLCNVSPIPHMHVCYMYCMIANNYHGHTQSVNKVACVCHAAIMHTSIVWVECCVNVWKACE